MTVLMLIAAGCGDDDAIEDAGADTTSPPTETTEATVPPPAGEPIVLSLIAPLEGSVAVESRLEGAQAAAAAINAAGGVQGRPIEILGCDGSLTSIDPTLGTACARDAVEAGVIASVGKLSGDDNVATIFEEASIPMVGSFPAGAKDFFSELSFPLQPGGAVSIAGQAAVLMDNGATKIGFVGLDASSTDLVLPFVAAALEPRGAELTNTVKIPPDPSTDVTPFVAQAISGGVDGIIVGMQGDAIAKVVGAARDAGYTGQFSMASNFVSSQIIESLGEDGEGMLLVGAYEAPTSDDAADFVDELTAFDADAEINEFAIESWAAVHLVADQLESLETIDSASLAAALDGLDVDLGIAPAFTLTQNDVWPPFARVFRAGLQYQIITDGAIQPLDDGAFVDPREV